MKRNLTILVFILMVAGTLLAQGFNARFEKITSVSDIQSDYGMYYIIVAEHVEAGEITTRFALKNEKPVRVLL